MTDIITPCCMWLRLVTNIAMLTDAGIPVTSNIEGYQDHPKTAIPKLAPYGWLQRVSGGVEVQLVLYQQETGPG